MRFYQNNLSVLEILKQSYQFINLYNYSTSLNLPCKRLDIVLKEEIKR